jgi:hypothetical protein
MPRYTKATLLKDAADLKTWAHDHHPRFHNKRQDETWVCIRRRHLIAIANRIEHFVQQPPENAK